ncbi:MAG: signal peptide peptidase SppA [Planctomycetes bacterium]|nr:signal peptide peptidase SppA [Planctomycetota bacterium]
MNRSVPLFGAFAIVLVGAFASTPAQASGADGSAKTAKVVEFAVKTIGEDPMPTNPLGPSAKNFRGSLGLLRKIAADPDVAGIQLKLKDTVDFAHSIELLGELRRAKAAGKKIVCYSETLDQRQLLFASVADSLVIPPSGQIVLTGLTAEVMYLKDLLDKIDMHYEVMHVGNFKTAFENYSHDSMSAEQRETISHLLDEFYGQMLDGIATNRGLTRSAVEALFDKVFVTPEQAKSAGLISDVGYEDQYKKSVEALVGGKFEVVKDYGDEGAEDLKKMMENPNPFALMAMLPKLLNPPKPTVPDEPCIAIVYATGEINSGKSQRGFSGDVSTMGCDTIVKALEKTLENDNIKAVVFRVNSPGGSAIASDMIWRAIQRVREKKPVVASMGYVAGSGGYWISMGCDKIIAQPSTITGSIGVVAAIPDVSKTLKTVGVNVEVVGKGPHAEELSFLRNGASPFLKKAITESMQRVYESFVAKASAGRKLDPAKLELNARGRVWTGREALGIGFVDKLGGLDDAIAIACELGGKLDAKKAPIVEYPESPNLIDQIKEMIDEYTITDVIVGRLLSELPDGVGSAIADALVATKRGFEQDRIQCLMPFRVTIR